LQHNRLAQLQAPPGEISADRLAVQATPPGTRSTTERLLLRFLLVDPTPPPGANRCRLLLVTRTPPGRVPPFRQAQLSVGTSSPILSPGNTIQQLGATLVVSFCRLLAHYNGMFFTLLDL